ncbi:MAG: hypothetical protein QG567_2484 [Campylobacterota bacterium]|nr:hypothetical protein [Campylobacterota bacterium]
MFKEITEDRFYSLLYATPPFKQGKNGFVLGEMLRDNIALFCIEKNNKYYEIEADLSTKISDIYFLCD